MAENRNLLEVKDEKELLLLRYLDLEFVDDVSDCSCGRCERVVIKHYISNCGHHFCFNCKKILEDGGPVNKWRCPVCQQFITHVDHQSVALAERVNALRVRCPNSRYGCPFISSINSMTEHMKECKNTKEAALPAIYKGTNTMQAVLEQVMKMNQKIDSLNERMNELENVDKVIKVDVDRAINELKGRMNGVQSELQTVTTNLKSNIQTNNVELLQTGQKDLLKQINDFQRANNTMQVEMEAKFTKFQETMQKQESQIQIEHQQFAMSLEATKAEFNGKTSLIMEMFDKKEERLTEKLNQIKLKMDDSVAKEKSSYLDGNQNKNAQMDSVEKTFEKIINQITTLETTQIVIEKELKTEMNTLQAKIVQIEERQMTTMDNFNEQTITEMQTHLQQAEDEIKNKIKENEDKIATMEEELHLQHLHVQPEAPNHEIYQSHSLVHTWIIKDIKKAMGQKTFQRESEVFPLNGYDFGAKAILQIFVEGSVYMTLCFVDYQNTERPIKFNLIPTVTYILRDQNGNKDVVKTSDEKSISTFAYGKHYYTERMIYKIKFIDSPFAIGDLIVLDIYMEPPTIAQLIHPTDGTMMCKIDNYKMKKAMETEGFVEYQPSPYFFTSSNEHRVQVRTFLNGRGELNGKKLVAIVMLLLGDFDSTLLKPFKHRTTVIIFNQINPNKHLVKIVERHCKQSSYEIDIAPHSEIEHGGFLLNDALIYKVVVESIDNI